MTDYYYSRLRILSFTAFYLTLFFGCGSYIYSTDDTIFSLMLSFAFFLTGIFFIILYRRIIIAVLSKKPALRITPTTIEFLGTKTFTWDDIEYYRLVPGVFKSSIEIKLYDNKEEAIRANTGLRHYLHELPLLSFNKSIVIVNLTFIIGENEYIIQNFETYDLLGQETQHLESTSGI